MKYAMAVAHPDDEVIFGGGIIACHPDLDWTVICCSTPRVDPIRVNRFYRAVEKLGVNAASVIDVQERIDNVDGLAFLDLERFDHIVTHGAAGEYGHENHKQVHRFVRERYGHKRLSFFGWPTGEHCLNLNAQQQGLVNDALRCYNHVSPLDGKPKWEALIERYNLNFERVYYDGDKIGLPAV